MTINYTPPEGLMTCANSHSRLRCTCTFFPLMPTES